MWKDGESWRIQLNRWKPLSFLCTKRFASLHKGFSPQDLTSYTCVSGHIAGHLEFNRQLLKHWKKRGTRLTCIECSNKEDRLLKILEHPDACRCTCQMIKKGQRLRIFFEQPVHQTKCRLHPSIVGEPRWLGQRKGISMAELEWLYLRKAKH